MLAAAAETHHAAGDTEKALEALQKALEIPGAHPANKKRWEKRLQELEQPTPDKPAAGAGRGVN